MMPAQPPPPQPPPLKRDPGGPVKLPEECQVCGTSANVRKNFGVPSCVSCRIFYSRNTGKQLICYQNGHCRIEGPSRKSCAACRFQKCMRAGMQKSRERKYKYRKGALVAKGSSRPTAKDSALQQQQQRKAQGLSPLAADDSNHPPLELFKDMGGLEASVMDKNLFVHFYKMADMFQVPFECDRDCLVVRDTLSGLGLLEAVTKRSLAIIRFLPHFSQLDRSLVSAMVSEKISGLVSILRALHYQPSSSLMMVRCSGNGSVSSDGRDLAGSMDDSPCGGGEILQQPLLHVIHGLFSDLTKGPVPLMTETEVSAVYLATARLFEQCHSLFQDRINIGVILLLGMYFFLPDYKTVRVDEALLRGYQTLYLRCLQDLLKVLSTDPADAMDKYNRVLFLVSEVKGVDFHLSMLSRHVRVQAD